MKVSMSDMITIDGEKKTFKQHCIDRQIIPQVAQRRVNVQGRDPVEAITAPVNHSRPPAVNHPWRKSRL